MSRRFWLALACVATGALIAGLGVASCQERMAQLKPRPLSVDRRIANSVWGKVCAGRVLLTVAPLRGRAGQASFVRFPGGERRACVVVIDQREWVQAFRCAVVVHEWGHLAGRGHSRDPRSVMAPRISQRNIPEKCRR